MALAPVTDAAIHNKMFGSGFEALIISNKEMKDIMKIFKSRKDSGLLIKVLSETIKNEAKEQKGAFLRMLLCNLDASLLGNLSKGKGQLEQVKEKLGQVKIFNASPHPLTNFEIQKHYKNEPKFNGVYSRNNFSKIKYLAYLINLDEYESIGTHSIALYLNDDNVTYFDSFRVKYIPKEKLENSLGKKYYNKYL